MKILNKVIIALIIMFGIICFSNNYEVKAASSLNLKNLDYNIQLNADGSMDIVETWDIDIKNTNTLFKTFTMDNTYGYIINSVVSEIKEDGTKRPLTKTYQEAYHVDEGSYYALVINNKEFEIAWGVGLDTSSARKKYEIKYTVTDCIHAYQDCAEVYWQLIHPESGIPADRVTGTIKLPRAVELKESLRAWAHGPLNGNITIDSKDTVSFELDYLDAGRYMEFRIAILENGIFTGVTPSRESKFASIVYEEEHLADEANDARDYYRTQRGFYNAALTIYIIFMGIMLIRYLRILLKTEKLKPTMEIDYFREIPNENRSVAEAAYLYYFKSRGMQNNISKVVSGTMLNLALKGYIEFLPDNTGKKEEVLVKILEIDAEKESLLTADERIIYNLIKPIPRNEEKTFTMKNLEMFAKIDCIGFLNSIERLEKIAENSIAYEKLYDRDRMEKANSWATKGIIYIVLACFGFCSIVTGYISTNIVIAAGILTLAVVLSCFAIHGRLRSLTQTGIDEAEQWKGLKKYMEDFSLLKEREVPELALWEKFLVFATAFGIADKVLKQLKIKYPEMDVYDDNYRLMRYMYRSSLMSTLDKEITRAYNTGKRQMEYNARTYNTGVSQRAINKGYSGTNRSSGKGFGGGFSGGGGSRGGFTGGGGGRRKNGRKIKEEKMREKLLKLIKNIFVIIGILVGGLIGLIIFTYADQAEDYKPYLHIGNIKYDINLNNDGSMDIIETWAISARNIMSLHKVFANTSQYADIENVEVYGISQRKSEIQFFNLDKRVDKVEAEKYYALKDNKNQLEIVWGIEPTQRNQYDKFKLCYTVKGCVKSYQDCQDILWELIGNDSIIGISGIDVTIKLPNEVSNMSNIKTWVHGDLKVEPVVSKDGLIKFKTGYLGARQNLGFRVTSVNENIFELVPKENINNFENIKEQEKQTRGNEVQIFNLKVNIVYAIMIGYSIFLIWRIARYSKILKNKQELMEEEEKITFFAGGIDSTIGFYLLISIFVCIMSCVILYYIFETEITVAVWLSVVIAILTALLLGTINKLKGNKQTLE